MSGLRFDFGGDSSYGTYHGWVAAYLDGVKVGYLDWASEDEDELWIKMVHVEPEHRGKGYAKAMLDYVIAQQTEFGDPVPTLWADHLTPEGQRWWRTQVQPHYPTTTRSRLALFVQGVVLYHGTDAELRPGEVLVPQHEGRSNHPLSAGSVYLTPDPGVALVYAEDFARPGQRPRVYEVRADAASDNPRDPFELQWTAPSAVVVREVPRYEVEERSRAMETDESLWSVGSQPSAYAPGTYVFEVLDDETGLRIATTTVVLKRHTLVSEVHDMVLEQLAPSQRARAQFGRIRRIASRDPDEIIREAAALDAQTYDALLDIRRQTGADRDPRVCGRATAIVESTLGLPQESGFYIGGGLWTLHSWNRLPDGAVLDITADQFGGEPIAVTSGEDYQPFTPEQQAWRERHQHDFGRDPTIEDWALWQVEGSRSAQRQPRTLYRGLFLARRPDWAPAGHESGISDQDWEALATMQPYGVARWVMERASDFRGMQSTGLGVHWSSEVGPARWFASADGVGSKGLAVVIEATYSGGTVTDEELLGEYDVFPDEAGEKEVPLPAGAALEVVAVWYSFNATKGDARWERVPFVWGSAVASQHTAGGESFLRQPHDTLYPCLFDERGNPRPGARDAIIGYFERNVVSVVPQARGHLRYAIIGSGASWNWDEAGDLDVQVWCEVPSLVSPLRSALAPHNLADLGTILGTPTCGMAVQFYVKAGRGEPIDNLATVPYAYYDLSDDRWYAFPQPLTPEWYAQRFVDVEDEAMALASKAQRAIAELERSMAAYAWWSQLASIHADPNFAAQLEQVRGEAGAAHAQVREVFEQAKRARMDAYLPGGEGIADPRDSVFKLLEVWDVMEPLKHYAQSPLAELLGVT